MKARFNKVKSRYVNKFGFDNNTTLGIGNVQPLFCKQLAGGSKVSVNFAQLTRLSPLVVPTFARLKQRNDFCFVPMSMIMPSFDAFLSQSAISGTNMTYTPDSVPVITNQALLIALISHPIFANVTNYYNNHYSKDNPIGASKISYYNNTITYLNFLHTVSNVPTLEQLPFSFFDFVFTSNDSIAEPSWKDNGVRLCVKLTSEGRFWLTVLRGLGYTLDVNDTNPVSILPLWAFAKAYYDLYYPKRTNPWHTSSYYTQINDFYNGDFLRINVGSLYYDFVKDFDVLVSLFGNYHSFDFFATIDDNLVTAATDNPINLNSAAVDNSLSVLNNGNYQTEGIQSNAAHIVPAPTTNPSTGDHTSNIPSLASPNTAQTYITADQLSLVNRLWNFVQKSSVVGQSVKDWFALHLGVRTNEDMFDQTILIKSVTNDVSVNPVISTAQTTSGSNGDNLGALAGQGYASKNDSVTFDARTFGYFMCLTSLVPISGVGCGTQPELYCNTIYEQQLPDFDAVGYEVLNKTSFNESIVSSNTKPNSDPIAGGFGYVPRLSSWKSIHNIRSGNFAINSIKDSFIPYCADVLPTDILSSSVLWRFPWSQALRFVSFNRMFYNQEPLETYAAYPIVPPLDDNFMSQTVFDFTYTSFLKPLSDSYSIESLGKDLVHVKEQ